jgi:hypothetical protein
MGMKTNRKTILLVALCLLLIVAGAIASASSDLVDSLSIPWWTADGGGDNSNGGPYVLRGTAGQSDAGRASGGDFSLAGGFWAAYPFEQGPIELYMPMVVK